MMEPGPYIPNDFIQALFDNQCKRCAGQGSFGFYTWPIPHGPAVFRRYPCGACNGTGFKPTDAAPVPEDRVHQGQV